MLILSTEPARRTSFLDIGLTRAEIEILMLRKPKWFHDLRIPGKGPKNDIKTGSFEHFEKNSTAQKTLRFFRPKLNQPVAVVVT